MTLASLHTLERVALGLADRAVYFHFYQLNVAADRVERCSKLMAHHCQELRFRAIRMRFSLVCPSQLFLRFALSSDVPEDHDRRDDVAACILHRGCVGHELERLPVV